MSRTEFKAGDRVWDITLGWGKVINILEDDYPIVCEFGDSVLYYYTQDGKCEEEDVNRSLYFDEFKINPPKEALEKKRWRADWGRGFFAINSIGDIHCIIDTHEEADGLWEIGNYFQTQEEAKQSEIYKLFQKRVNDLDIIKQLNKMIEYCKTNANELIKNKNSFKSAEYTNLKYSIKQAKEEFINIIGDGKR
jgi:hypothetical protein